MTNLNITHEQKSFKEEFIKPLFEISKMVKARKCPQLTYYDHLLLGIERILSESISGRAFVQQSVEQNRIHNLEVRTLFKAISSKHRLKYLQEINKKLFENNVELLDDSLEDIPELKKFALYAGDGHYHAHATHEEKIDDKYRSTGNLYFIDMRSHLMKHLDVVKSTAKNKRKHDIKTLKEKQNLLRFNTPKGKKVLITYDRASIDFHFWWCLKKSKGVYFLTREKSNMKLKDNIIGLNNWEKSDPRNIGIKSDELCGCHAHVSVRRIVYIDPEDGKEIVFITNEMTIPPGVLAYLYKLRWNIEKKFDSFKNTFLEKKSWCKNITGKYQQALFLCIAHNLITIFEHRLKVEENIIDKKCFKEKEKRIEEYKNNMIEKKLTPNPLFLKLRKLSKFSLQFIRTIRNKLFISASWQDFLVAIRPSMEQYFW